MLDLPAGTGRWTDLCVRRKLRYMGGDISREMLNVARKQAREHRQVLLARAVRRGRTALSRRVIRLRARLQVPEPAAGGHAREGSGRDAPREPSLSDRAVGLPAQLRIRGSRLRLGLSRGCSARSGACASGSGAGSCPARSPRRAGVPWRASPFARACSRTSGPSACRTWPCTSAKARELVAPWTPPPCGLRCAGLIWRVAGARSGERFPGAYGRLFEALRREPGARREALRRAQRKQVFRQPAPGDASSYAYLKIYDRRGVGSFLAPPALREARGMQFLPSLGIGVPRVVAAGVSPVLGLAPTLGPAERHDRRVSAPSAPTPIACSGWGRARGPRCSRISERSMRCCAACTTPASSTAI